MTLTLDVTVKTNTSDQDPHAARQAPGRCCWEVARLSGPVLERGTAMLLAGTAGERDLPVPDAITRASEPPKRTSNQEHATSRADPEAGL
jgi:hypothetical protein